MLIIVEGCVGAGKSTVAEGLAAYRNSKTLLENFEANPFLPAFYENPVAHAVETEFTFLLLHFHQLKRHADAVSSLELITDFHLGKDLLYAELNLIDSQTRHVFRELYELLVHQVPTPSLMICLSASTDLLVDRIRQRERHIELKIDPNYYGRVNAAYEEFFDLYCGRKLNIPMDEWNFVQSPDLYRKLSLLVDEQLKAK
jgi:deoxyadenosine/deoxycytidine kinase